MVRVINSNFHNVAGGESVTSQTSTRHSRRRSYVTRRRVKRAGIRGARVAATSRTLPAAQPKEAPPRVETRPRPAASSVAEEAGWQDEATYDDLPGDQREEPRPPSLPAEGRYQQAQPEPANSGWRQRPYLQAEQAYNAYVKPLYSDDMRDPSTFATAYRQPRGQSETDRRRGSQYRWQERPSLSYNRQNGRSQDSAPRPKTARGYERFRGDDASGRRWPHPAPESDPLGGGGGVENPRSNRRVYDQYRYRDERWPQRLQDDLQRPSYRRVNSRPLSQNPEYNRRQTPADEAVPLYGDPPAGTYSRAYDDRPSSAALRRQDTIGEPAQQRQQSVPAAAMFRLTAPLSSAGGQGRLIPAREARGRVLPSRRVDDTRVVPSPRRVDDGQVVPSSRRVDDGRVVPSSRRVDAAVARKAVTPPPSRREKLLSPHFLRDAYDRLVPPEGIHLDDLYASHDYTRGVHDGYTFDDDQPDHYEDHGHHGWSLRGLADKIFPSREHYHHDDHHYADHYHDKHHADYNGWSLRGLRDQIFGSHHERLLAPEIQRHLSAHRTPPVDEKDSDARWPWHVNAYEAGDDDPPDVAFTDGAADTMAGGGPTGDVLAPHDPRQDIERLQDRQESRVPPHDPRDDLLLPRRTGRPNSRARARVLPPHHPREDLLLPRTELRVLPPHDPREDELLPRAKDRTRPHAHILPPHDPREDELLLRAKDHTGPHAHFLPPHDPREDELLLRAKDHTGPHAHILPPHDPREDELLLRAKDHTGPHAHILPPHDPREDELLLRAKYHTGPHAHLLPPHDPREDELMPPASHEHHGDESLESDYDRHNHHQTRYRHHHHHHRHRPHDAGTRNDVTLNDVTPHPRLPPRDQMSIENGESTLRRPSHVAKRHDPRDDHRYPAQRRYAPRMPGGSHAALALEMSRRHASRQRDYHVALAPPGDHHGRHAAPPREHYGDYAHGDASAEHRRLPDLHLMPHRGRGHYAALAPSSYRYGRHVEPPSEHSSDYTHEDASNERERLLDLHLLPHLGRGHHAALAPPSDHYDRDVAPPGEHSSDYAHEDASDSNEREMLLDLHLLPHLGRGHHASLASPSDQYDRHLAPPGEHSSDYAHEDAPVERERLLDLHLLPHLGRGHHASLASPSDQYDRHLAPPGEHSSDYAHEDASVERERLLDLHLLPHLGRGHHTVLAPPSDHYDRHVAPPGEHSSDYTHKDASTEHERLLDLHLLPHLGRGHHAALAPPGDHRGRHVAPPGEHSSDHAHEDASAKREKLLDLHLLPHLGRGHHTALAPPSDHYDRHVAPPGEHTNGYTHEDASTEHERLLDLHLMPHRSRGHHAALAPPSDHYDRHVAPPGEYSGDYAHENLRDLETRRYVLEQLLPRDAKHDEHVMTSQGSTDDVVTSQSSRPDRTPSINDVSEVGTADSANTALVASEEQAIVVDSETTATEGVTTAASTTVGSVDEYRDHHAPSDDDVHRHVIGASSLRNGTMVARASARRYVRRARTACIGQNIDELNASLQDCARACERHAQCAAFSYSAQLGKCWRKYECLRFRPRQSWDTYVLVPERNSTRVVHHTLNDDDDDDDDGGGVDDAGGWL